MQMVNQGQLCVQITKTRPYIIPSKVQYVAKKPSQLVCRMRSLRGSTEARSVEHGFLNMFSYLLLVYSMTLQTAKVLHRPMT